MSHLTSRAIVEIKSFSHAECLRGQRAEAVARVIGWLIPEFELVSDIYSITQKHGAYNLNNNIWIVPLPLY